MKKFGKKVTVIFLLLVLAFSSVLLTACDGGNDGDEDDTAPAKGYYVEKTERYYLDELNCVVLDLPIGILFNGNKSYFELRPDGSIEIRAMLKDATINSISSILKDYGANLSSIDLQSTVDTYVTELMPAFTLKDIPFSLGLLEASLGIEVVGFDTEHEGIQALCESLAETARLPDELNLPYGLGLVYRGNYYIEDLTSVTTGEVFKAVYTGNSAENGEPYGIMTLSVNDDGKRTISLHIEFLNTDIVGVAP